MNRSNIIQEAIIEEYGDDVDELDSAVSALLEEYPDAQDQEIIDFLSNHLIEFEEIEDVLELVEDFKTEWGRK